MINHSLDLKKLILRLEPTVQLVASDFEKLSQKVDPVIKKHGHLNGVLIVASSFPGWKDFDGLFAHLQFIKDHHKNVEKVALVTTDTLIKLGAGRISKYHFLHPEIQIFDKEKEAINWLSA